MSGGILILVFPVPVRVSSGVTCKFLARGSHATKNGQAHTFSKNYLRLGRSKGHGRGHVHPSPGGFVPTRSVMTPPLHRKDISGKICLDIALLSHCKKSYCISDKEH